MIQTVSLNRGELDAVRSGSSSIFFVVFPSPPPDLGLRPSPWVGPGLAASWGSGPLRYVRFQGEWIGSRSMGTVLGAGSAPDADDTEFCVDSPRVVSSLSTFNSIIDHEKRPHSMICITKGVHGTDAFLTRLVHRGAPKACLVRGILSCDTVASGVIHYGAECNDQIISGARML